MIKQELEFLPHAAANRHALGADPNNEAQQTWETCVADDYEEGTQDEGQGGTLEGNHGVGCQREAKIVEHGCWCKDAPIAVSEPRYRGL